MKVLFFVVNYRADQPLRRLLESVGRAGRLSPETRISVHVLDNSLKDEAARAELNAALAHLDLPVVVEHATENLGYFGGLPKAQAAADGADCAIYANPDILIDDDFFLCLERTRGNAAVLAPRILPLPGGADLNPKYDRRLPRTKLRQLSWIFSNPVTYHVYHSLATLRERASRSVQDRPRQRIYCPHGSIFVFEDIDFFRALPRYPCFLYGEELFVAEEARLAGRDIWYEPALKVTDLRHASVSLLPSERRRLSYHESVCYILKQYYGDDAARPQLSESLLNGPTPR